MAVLALATHVVAGHLVTACRDHECVMVDKRGGIRGMLDDRDGHVIGLWDKQGRFVVGRPKCAFVNSEKLQTRELMLLEQEFGWGMARYYDVKHPAIALYRSHVNLSILTHDLIDPPHVQIDVDPCTGKILSHERLAPY
jgi:hypothetical protein